MLFTLAVLLFAIPLVPSVTKHSRPSPSRVAEPPPHPQTEARFKHKLVQQDMQATELLSRAQVNRDVRNFLRGKAKPDSDRTLRTLMRTHPEIHYAEWANNGKKRQLTASAVKPGLLKAAESHLALARSKPSNKKDDSGFAGYSSPIFDYGGKSYYVLSQHEETNGGKQSVVALVSSDVIQAVERHQRRNLRLVPYPPEGRYRIESVTPGSNNETTVRTGEDNGNASHYAVDEIVVKFRQPLKDRQLLQLRKHLELSVVRHTRQTYVFRSKKLKTEELKKYFADNWNPEFVEPHYLYLTNELQRNGSSGIRPEKSGATADTAFDASDEKPIIPNDTLYSEYQWNLPEIATENGWNLSKGSKDIIVAVVDTGVQADHPDLKGRLVGGTNIVDPSKPPDDDVGHGTHVAGIIAAEVNNNEGVAGMTWYTKIMPVKVLDSTGAGSTYSVAEGIIWATDHGAHVINMSLGNYAQADFLHDALKYAYDHGVILVAASGNDNTDRPGYPAAYPEVIAVSATDPDESRAEYSNFGDYIDVAAPGTSIPSTYPGSRYASLSGTSMASPHVAALASLVRSANPNLTNAEVMDLLNRTAKDLGKKGKDVDYGNGQIDVRAALRSASSTNVSLQLYPQQVRRQLEALKEKVR
ncbi:peptidase S8 [Cohnella endophytica]|uniref:Peptidase S8 n=2 Tax=Cohnella endophytica TaxID=2419778 RepID=A0A494Y6R4_9BACL|nr:peptidase S8 [Cohnella endophytica]